MKKKLLLPLIIFLALAITLMVQLTRNAQGEDPKKLESAKTGSPRLLNVWATWCPTCYAEHEYLTLLAKQGVEIVGVDYKDERPKAMKFLMTYGNPYKAIIYDPKGSLGLDLGVYGAPETFIVDGNGIIQYRHAGDVNERVWNEVLKPIYEKLKAK